MGKGVAAGIVIALLTGTAIGYFLLPIVFPTQATDGRQTYFVDELAGWTPTGTMTEIAGLKIDVTTQSGDSLELYLTGYYNLIPSVAPSYERAEFRFAVDGVEVAEEYWIREDTDYASQYSFAIAYRYIATGIAPTTHNVTVRVAVTGNIGLATVNNLVLSVIIL